MKRRSSKSDSALRLPLGDYGTRYRKNQQLKKSQVQRFLLSARRPQKSRLKRWGYEATELAGVYRSGFSLHNLIPIISLNELSREPHNAIFKCFAKDPEEQKYALAQLRKMGIANKLSEELSQFLSGLWSQWLLGEQMKIQFTAEQVMEIGEVWGDVYLHNLPAEKILSRYKPEERIAGLNLSERLAGISSQELEAYLENMQRQKLSNGA